MEGEDTKSWVLATSSGANGVHTELRDTAVDGPDTCRSAQHRTDCSSTAAVVADLEDLQLGILLACANVDINTALEDGGTDSISRHVCIRVSRDGWANVQARRVVLEVGVQEVGIDGVNDVAGD